jgi:uncharacterized protein YcnI
MQRRSIAGFATAAFALGLPAVAQAHVTLQPSSQPAGAETVLNVRVPNERDNASTVKVDVRLPPGFVEADVEPQAGWTVKVVRSKLAKPIQTDDGPISESVSQITWTGSGKGEGAIPPGGFKDFPMLVLIPGKAGDRLTFKALQTYSNGAIVRWIGAPSSDSPAPQVSVTGDVASTPAGATTTPASPASTGSATPATAVAQKSDGASKGLGVAALIAGILGLLLGAGALVLSARRTRSTRTVA